ncbi:MAG TPA: TonB-dependent receptor [Gemmatimonadaceae bacterium]|jgi:TonB-linked SusC/RagA family outer membrane protein|nr:TonB-dependent receptor [Gemmatimonadaceae bacterium]
MRKSVHLLLIGAAMAPLGAVPGGAQVGTGTIQGIVRTTEAGAPLPDVNIVVVGTRTGAQSRPDGRYTIASVVAGTYTLRATRIGYTFKEQPVTVGAGQVVTANIDLAAAAVSLERVVTVGYGTQSSREVTGSVSSVTTNEISTMPVPRVDEALSGLVSGVQVQTTNAQPGSELRIRVRGGNSMQGNNEPLIVVDGVIGADLNQVNPNDIETIDVLKDASSAAIYGARAANGVILVTTKRGLPGNMRFEYNAYSGMQQVSKHIDLLSGNEFALMFMRNPNHDKSVTFDTTGTLPTTDWQNVVYRTAPMQSHEVRVSGSSGGTSIMSSASMLQQKGIVLNSTFNRGSLRFNLDQTLGDRVKAGTRVTYSHSTNSQVRVNDGYGSGGGPVTMMALRFAPTIPVYTADGGYSGPLLPSQTMDNPLAIVNLLQNKATTDYLLGNLFADVELAKQLTFRSAVSYTQNDGLGQRYTSRLLRAALGSGQANVDNSARSTFLGENTLTFQHAFGQHAFTLLGGMTAQEFKSSASGSQGVGFTSDLLGYSRINLAETITATSSSSRERLLSYLGRMNYAYSGKYLLTATYRADGASKFAVNNKWARFPSVGGAWRVSDERFFANHVPFVTELKLRASTGRTGSEAISAYQSLAAWSVGSPYDLGTTRFNNGANPSRNSNPNLRWETTRQTDIGFDMGLFSNRVGLTFDNYKKRTYDLLYSKQVPYYTGYTDYVTNIGSVQNQGTEIGIDTRQRVRAVDVRLGGNVSWNRSKVLDLGGDTQFFLDGVNGSLPTFRPAAIVRVGEPLGNYFGYLWDGIFQTAAEAAASGQSGAVAGGMKLRDVNGDGKITTDDRVILGNAQPKYIVGQNGFFGWRVFSLSYVLRAVEGFKVVNLNRQGMETPGDNVNTLRSTLHYWTPGSGINDMTGIGIGPFNQMTSRWIEDGSFVRLQNVTLGWDVPARLASHLNAENLRVYGSAQNLKTWTKYSWYDPEASSRGTSDLQLGWDDSSYPGVRTFTVGLNVRF